MDSAIASPIPIDAPVLPIDQLITFHCFYVRDLILTNSTVFPCNAILAVPSVFNLGASETGKESTKRHDFEDSRRHYTDRGR